MRALAVILVAAAFFFAVYHFYLKKMPALDEGTAPTQAISLVGVRSDLLQIALAERSYIALNSRCASFEELNSSSSLPVPRTGRNGYSYSLECSGNDFTAAARHQPAPAGSPVRYPNLAINANMHISEVH